MEIVKLKTPLTKDMVSQLRAGTPVHITGTIYTARDAAHKRMIETVHSGGVLPFDIKDSTIYYVGPSPAKPGKPIGSAGPTTSYRMDDYTLPLLEMGLRGMIGKGHRSQQVIQGMIDHGAVYFAATGGAGALIADAIKFAEVIAYEDLGPEAIMRLEVVNFPTIVVIDTKGNNLYDSERIKYEETVRK